MRDLVLALIVATTLAAGGGADRQVTASNPPPPTRNVAGVLPPTRSPQAQMAEMQARQR